MKKMFLTLALVLVGSFAFASNEVSSKDLSLENYLKERYYYVIMNSCGGSYSFSTSSELSSDDVFDLIDLYDELSCP